MAIFNNPIEKAVARIKEIRETCSSYKIGKTGMLLEDRLVESDYCGVYDAIEPVFESNSKEMCSYAEAQLIDAFVDDLKCDNEKDGEHSKGDEMKDTPPYYVYVVSKGNIR